MTPDNVTETGEPGDLSAAATDEFGGPERETGRESDDRDASDIAADDAGTGALLGRTGVTAGGNADFGVGGLSGPEAEAADTEIAADDAGASRAAEAGTGRAPGG